MSAINNLPTGVVNLTTAMEVNQNQPRLTIKGHPDGTILKNIDGGGWYPNNNTFFARGISTGYVDGITGFKTDTNQQKDGQFLTRVVFPTGFSLADYNLYFNLFRYDGYGNPGGMMNTLLKIVSKQNNQIIALGPKPPEGVNSAKWYLPGTVRCKTATLGNDILTVDEPHTFNRGDLICIGCGPEDANNLDVQYKKITRVEPNKIIISSPLDRSYNADRCVIFKPRPVNQLTLDSLELAETPMGHNNSTAFFQSCNDLVLMNVVSDGVLWFAGCNKITVINCDIRGLAFNNCQNVLVKNSNIGSIQFEESCFDCIAEDLTLGYPEWGVTAFGVDWWTTNQNITLRRSVISGSGELNWANYPAMQMFCGGKNMTFDDVTIKNSKNNSASFIGGEGLVVSNLKSDGATYITNGKTCRIFNSQKTYAYPDTQGSGLWNEPAIFEGTDTLASKIQLPTNFDWLKEKSKVTRRLR